MRSKPVNARRRRGHACVALLDARRRVGDAGFTLIELLLGVALISLAVAATSGMFLASKWHIQMQHRELETTQAARAAIDMIVRDLRLGGACLPVTGDFISLTGTDVALTDEIVTRTGLTRPDLSCIRSVVPTGMQITASGSTVPVLSSEGFAPQMHAYLRHPDGTGEYFTVASVNSATELGKTQALSRNYPETTGVYAIDERRFYLATVSTPHGPEPQLMLQVGDADPQAFAGGIEKLDIRYQLQRNCPPCDEIALPSSNAEWAIVDAVLVDLTARSLLPDKLGNYYRRNVTVSVKPRNLLPR